MTRPLRVLAVSHAGVVEVNRRLFELMADADRFALTLVVPRQWPVHGRRAVAPATSVGPGLRVLSLPVIGAGQVTLHGYLQLPLGQRPDVVLVDEQAWSVAAQQFRWLARRSGAALAFVNHQNIYKRYPPPFNWLERSVYQAAQLALVSNAEAGQVLVRKGYRGRVETLPHGVDLPLFWPGDEPPLRSALGLSGIVIGYLGRLVPEKGIDLLVEACQRLPRGAWSLLLVGSGPAEAGLRRMVREAGLEDHVRFQAAVDHDQAARYLRCMDVLVLPSRTTPGWKEQFGRVLIEAWACAKPVLGSDSGNIPVLIEETRGGLAFRENDVLSLHDALRVLIKDEALRKTLGSTGAKYVRAHYDLGSVAERLSDLLDSLAL